MKKIGKITWIVVKSLLIYLVLWGVTTTVIQNVIKIIKVENFKSQAIYDEKNSTSTVKYYVVKGNDDIPSYELNGTLVYPGYEADILTSPNATLIGPITSNLVSFFVGGHAAICMNDYNDFQIKSDIYKSVESTGLGSYGKYADLFSKSYWIFNNPFNEVIGLRAKLTESQRKEVMSLAASYVGDPYNYSFLFDTTNKSYCSDLVSKVFEKVNVNLNKNSFVTTVYDIINSSDVYISYYQYYDNNGVKYIYYLG